MIPQKYGPLLFSLILSGLMSLLVSGVTTLRNVGLEPDFPELWVTSWLTAWLFAFPIVLLVAPFTQRLVRLMVASK